MVNNFSQEYYIWKIGKAINNICEVRNVTPKKNQTFNSIFREAFWIDKNIGNNSYGFKNGAKLFCAEIKEFKEFDLELGQNPVFRDHEDNKEFVGLNHYLMSNTLNSKTPIFICDNHNLVLEAWELFKNQKYNLIHIDQHFDNAKYAGSLVDDWRVSTRICDYINFAKSSEWIGEILSFVESIDMKKIDKIENNGDVILNIDIDFFAPEMTLISIEEKIKLIFESAKNAKLITLATSPGFIDQKLAIKIAELLFKYL